MEGKLCEKCKAVKSPKTDMSGKGFVAMRVASKNQILLLNSTLRNDFARYVRFRDAELPRASYTKITTCTTKLTRCAFN